MRRSNVGLSRTAEPPVSWTRI